MKYASSKRKKLLVLMLVVTISALTIISVLLRNVLFTSLEGIETWISLLSIVGLIVTIVIAITELRNSKEISRATFIVRLNQTFIENEQYKKLYDLMQSCIDKKCSYATNGLFCSNGCKIGVDKSIISYYLTFFETLYILYQRDVISFDIIDDLFAYRFFLVVHSKLVHQEKLIPQHDNFKNIFRLEHDWIEYRIKIGKMDRSELKQAELDYRAILDGAKSESSDQWRNVFVARPLKAIMNAAEYEKWINDRS